jgi:hypothetical protein
MLSWFSLLDLRDALTRPGCPICQIRWKSASRYLDFLLYENVNDVDTRLNFWAGMGYCHEHTILLAETDRKNEEKPTGMNILYESLASVVKKAISEYPITRERSNPLREIFLHLSPGRFAAENPKNLTPKSTCRVCQIADDSAWLGLQTLMQCLQEPGEKVYTLYIKSDGICLPHLRMALEEFTERYPSAVMILKEHAVNHLQDWEQAMGEYVRKNAWQNRHETITDEEKLALQRTLAFFTGYSPQTFKRNGNHETKDD